jgi:uncharacterized protein YdeI (YjbR/CyaY-like superfamily)
VELHPKDDLPLMPFESPDAWEAWLERHHSDSSGVWLQIAKKASGIPSITYAEALDVALCYGWIDGQKGSLDADYFLQRFTPRRAKSKWSKINVDKVARLTETGRMRPAGVAQVEAAKTDGRWEAAYGGMATIAVPEDLAAALDANPAAQEFFETINRTNRYAVLYRIHDAKRPDTRAKRIATIVQMLAQGKTFH